MESLIKDERSVLGIKKSSTFLQLLPVSRKASAKFSYLPRLYKNSNTGF